MPTRAAAPRSPTWEPRRTRTPSVAYLTTSGGNDYLVGHQTYSLGAGTGYINYALGFANVSGTAGSSNTIAELYDSPGNDTFTGTGSQGTIVGQGYAVVVNNMGLV